MAFVGKGGSGKSTAVGTFARLLARSGDPTLVVDSDVMPGLAAAMGVPVSDAPIPDEAVEASDGDDGPPFRLREGLSAEAALEAYALRGPDGVRLLQMGKLRTEGVWTLRASQHAYRQIIRELPHEGWHVVGDLPAGTRQPFFGWAGFADVVIAVVEPTVKSFMTARRLRRLQDQEGAPRMVALANKVRSEDDVPSIAEATGLSVVGSIPYDDAVRDADRAGVALVDHAPDSPAVAAISSFVGAMRATTMREASS